MMLSIIIPTYNERENVLPLVGRIGRSVRGEYELVIVDDNSPDGTAAEAEALSNSYPLRVVKRKGKLGLTSAVIDGVAASKGALIVVMDADLSHPPEKIPELAEALSKSDLAVGSRMAKGGSVESWPMHRRVISKCAELAARLVIRCGTSDPLSGFFAAKREIFLKTRFRTKGYKLLLNILEDNPGLRITDVPYVFRDRHAGKTKLGAFEVFNYLADLARIKRGKG